MNEERTSTTSEQASEGAEKADRAVRNLLQIIENKVKEATEPLFDRIEDLERQITELRGGRSDEACSTRTQPETGDTGP
jgi:hypothetical protein